MATFLRKLKIDRVDCVDEPANQHARIELFKRVAKGDPALGDGHVNVPDWRVAEKAVLDSGTRNALPDSAFAAVWTDADGHKQRKLPFKRADGSIDLPHLRNALSRLPQSDLPADVKAEAKRKLEAAAKEHDVGDTSKSLIAKLKTFFKGLDPEAMAQWADEENAEPEHQKSDSDVLKECYSAMGKALDTYGDGAGLPADHPFHALKALHNSMGTHLSTKGNEGEVAMAKQDETVNKAVADAVAVIKEDFEKRLKASDDRAAAAEAVAKAAKDAMDLDAQRVALRKFTHLTLNVDEQAPIFKSLAETNKPAYDAMMVQLASADAIAAKGAQLETDLGSPLAGTGGGTAWAEIEAEAAKIVAKGEAGMTKHKAIDLVMRQRTDLVKRYYAESGQAQ